MSSRNAPRSGGDSFLDKFRLPGKTALVTGGSRGIGRAIALGLAEGGGSIINIGSIDGIRPRVGAGVYSISKAGIIMLTQVLAEEWGQHNIRVNAIALGIIRTRFSEALWGNPGNSRKH